jgi:predicted RNA binding protein YcfA (HicA-like mRNA interferase family)
MKQSELIRLLEDAGFILVRSNGHLIYKRGGVALAVPHHRMVNGRTAHNVLRKAGLK